MPWEKKIALKLKQQKKTLAVAESCSGGLLAHRLTNIPGSSAYFYLGLIVYSNQAKKKLLKVSPKTLSKYGAVSAQTAMAMAKAVRKILPTDIGCATTGIAGPTGATKSKPVGLIYISVSTLAQTICRKYHFKGNRRSIKSQTATHALKLIDQCIA